VNGGRGSCAPSARSYSPSCALTGSLTAGTQPLSIGGNSVWGEWFQGRIDEVRVPNRVLSAPDLQGDMARAVSGGA